MDVFSHVMRKFEDMRSVNVRWMYVVKTVNPSVNTCT